MPNPMNFDNASLTIEENPCPGGGTTPVIKGCLENTKVAVKCNPNGTYTVTLNGSSFSGTDIAMTSQTAGVTVTPPQQPWSATTTWTVTGATAGQTVVLTANATKAGGGKEGTDLCCSGEITIVMPECRKQEVGQVIVEKKVKNDTRASNATINALIFPIGLTCGPPSTLNTSFNLNNGGSHTENNVPYGSLCTVTESVSTLPPVPKDVCPRGTIAVWLPPVIVPPSATIGAPVTAFTVVNELQCTKLGEVCRPPMVMGPAGQCICPQGTVLVGKECIKQPPICLPPMIPGPVLGQCICPPGTVQSGKECVKPHTCPAPFVMGPDDRCICPAGTVQSGNECVKPHTCPAPFVMGPDDRCICPRGTVLKGKECVKFTPITCRPPMIPSATGMDCVCRPGLVQRGRRCVEPVVCKPPATLNSRGACQCPPGMAMSGNRCVDAMDRRQTISPGDIIHIPGGGRGPRGGRDDDPRGGGHDNGPPRGGGRDNDPPRGGQGMDFPGRR
jgi:hypothetical protein